VTIGRKISLTPQQVQVDGQTFVWAPSEWEALHLKGYETPVANLLPSLIHPGQTIYDLGANLGIYSIWFSRLAGPRGRVYSIEANPLCVYFLQANLALNQVWNCEILPVAVADSPGSLDFTINYGNSALGITQESGFYASKIGHEITVASFALDELIESLNLASPDVVKIDIEGAEEYAIIGMQKTLARCHPLLILEVHGRQAAHPTFRRLHDLGYCFQEIAHKQTFETLDSLLAWLPEAVLQFLCSPLV
jgi:FkbM family methyltransferase